MLLIGALVAIIILFLGINDVEQFLYPSFCYFSVGRINIFDTLDKSLELPKNISIPKF